jgi:hypothetical protein
MKSMDRDMAMSDPLTPAECRELEEFIAHLETLTEDDLQIVETRVYTYPAD